jgi:hypothetical protein
VNARTPNPRSRATQGVLLVAIGDRPWRAELLADAVEERPHLGQHLPRHEVRVHVDEAGQPEAAGVGDDVGVVGRRCHRGAHSVRPCPSSGCCSSVRFTTERDDVTAPTRRRAHPARRLTTARNFRFTHGMESAAA